MQSTGQRGHLVIIGGGERPLSIMEKIVELSGGKASRIVIIPIASEDPQAVSNLQKLEFLALGVAHVDIVHCTREDADTQSNLDCLARATGVFFSGGDQRKLTAALLGTRLLDEIRGVYRRRGVIAGTSAGAAVMSRIMITGDALPAAPFVQTSDGFGFVDRAIIDQHFIKRARHDRLRHLAQHHPELLGIGIDEETAIVVAADGTFEILGESHVLVFEAHREADKPAPERREPSTSSPKVHVLSSGERYCMNRRQRVAS